MLDHETLLTAGAPCSRCLTGCYRIWSQPALHVALAHSGSITGQAGCFSRRYFGSRPWPRPSVSYVSCARSTGRTVECFSSKPLCPVPEQLTTDPSPNKGLTLPPALQGSSAGRGAGMLSGTRSLLLDGEHSLSGVPCSSYRARFCRDAAEGCVWTSRLRRSAQVFGGDAGGGSGGSSAASCGRLIPMLSSDI